MASWRSCSGPLIVTVAKSWGKIPTVHRTKILKRMCLPCRLSDPWHARSQASGLSFMLSAQWPLLFSFWLDSFGLSASFAQARWASSAPSGPWSPVIVICAVGYDRMVSKHSGAVQSCFLSLGSVWMGPKGSLSARGAHPPGGFLERGFLALLPLYFATHQQQLLLPLHPVRL